MFGLKLFSWLCLALLLITYGVFGWLIGESISASSAWLIEYGRSWNIALETLVAQRLVIAFGVGVVLLMTVPLAAPLTVLRIFVGRWFVTDNRVIAWVLCLGVIVVLLCGWLDQLIRLFILLCAALLARLEMQNSGYNEAQVLFVVSVACLVGYVGGILTFQILSA